MYDVEEEQGSIETMWNRTRQKRKTSWVTDDILDLLRNRDVSVGIEEQTQEKAKKSRIAY